ncbi:hypothetical protein [Sphingomonas swuensis]
MMMYPSIRKPWAAPSLTRIVPDARLVRHVLDANGIRDVPPGLAQFVAPVASDSDR